MIRIRLEPNRANVSVSVSSQKDPDHDSLLSTGQ